MKVFSIFGVSDSGKTTSAELIIAELRSRGYTVGSVKDIHFEKFVMDKEGTDTWRHSKAGSELVTARGLYETDILFPTRLSLKRLLSFYSQDYVVLEGANNFLGPAIISAHKEQEVDDRLRDTVFAIVGRVASNISDYKGLPVIDVTKDVNRIVDLIEEKVPAWTGQSEWLEEDE